MTSTHDDNYLAESIDHTVGRLDGAIEDVKYFMGTTAWSLMNQVGKDYTTVLQNTEQANANLGQLIKDHPRGALRVAAGAIVVLHVMAMQPEKGKKGTPLHVVPDNDLEEMLDADNKDNVLMAAVEAIEAEMAILRGRGEQAETLPEDEILWAFAMDLRGISREGNVGGLLKMLDVMSQSSYPQVRDMAARIGEAAAKA